jgi:hypothetical protein
MSHKKYHNTYLKVMIKIGIKKHDYERCHMVGPGRWQRLQSLEFVSFKVLDSNFFSVTFYVGSVYIEQKNLGFKFTPLQMSDVIDFSRIIIVGS